MIISKLNIKTKPANECLNQKYLKIICNRVFIEEYMLASQVAVYAA